MKKMATNNNDYSFENHYKFEDLVTKTKAMWISFLKNRRSICFSGAMIGWILFSAYSLSSFAKQAPQAFHAIKVMADSDDESQDKLTNEYLSLIDSNVIAVLENDISCEKELYFDDERLYDKDGNVITLDNMDNPLAFVSCKISSETFDNIHLANSNCKMLSLQNCAIDNDFINYLPESLESLSLEKCNFITNLDGLPEACPNIKTLFLNNTSGLDNFDFIYNLPNLKYVVFSDCTHANEELLEYLNSNNIITDLDIDDIYKSNKLDAIVSEIITPDMDSEERIQAVCQYVLDNLEYDIDKHTESNLYPISCCLDDGKVVCISYARFTQELLNRAGVNSYSVFNDSHGWNLVEVEGKYYYIDTTSIDQFSSYKWLLNNLNVSGYYMSDVETTFLSSMTKPNDLKTLIPKSLVDEILKSNEGSSFLNKGGSMAGNVGIYLLSLLGGMSLSFIKYPVTSLKKEIPWLIDEIKEDYEENLVLQKKRK